MPQAQTRSDAFLSRRQFHRRVAAAVAGGLALGQLPAASLAQAPARQTPMFTEMDLFISGHDNVNIYRIPSLIAAPSGTLLAFIEAREGDDGDPTDLVLKRSPYAAAQPRSDRGSAAFHRGPGRRGPTANRTPGHPWLLVTGGKRPVAVVCDL